MKKRISLHDLVRLVKAADSFYVNGLRYEVTVRHWESTDDGDLALGGYGTEGSMWSLSWRELKKGKQIKETEMRTAAGNLVEFLQLRPMQINSRRT